MMVMILNELFFGGVSLLLLDSLLGGWVCFTWERWYVITSFE